MRGFVLVLVAVVVFGALPTIAVSDGPDHTGTVPVGAGRPVVEDVDHVRFGIPSGAVGIVPHDNPDTGMQPALFGLVTTCPPGMVCAQTAVVVSSCLAVFAPTGAALTPFAFSWAFDDGAGVVGFDQLPAFFSPSRPPWVPSTPVFCA